VWCGKTGSHHLHTGQHQRAGDVTVCLAYDEAWGAPKLHIGHYQGPDDASTVLLPLSEVDDMGKLLIALDRPEIAELVTEVAADVRIT